jgi:hypothetical protein
MMEVSEVKCKHTRELLSAYADNELPISDLNNIENHLATCNSCLKILNKYRSTGEYLTSLGKMQIEIPDSEEIILQQIVSHKDYYKAFNWARFSLAAIPIAIILITLFVLQPWNNVNNNSVMAMEQTISAMGKLNSYKVNESVTLSSTTLEYNWEFSWPDRIHLMTQKIMNTTQNGVLVQNEEINEYYFIGEKQYFLINNTKSLNYNSMINRVGGIPDQGHTVEMLQYLSNPQELTEESIDGFPCFHFKGSPMLGSSTVELWIDKDQYLIRKMVQIYDSGEIIIRRYFDFNIPIAIQAPIAESGSLLNGWNVKDDVHIVQSAIAGDPSLYRDIIKSTYKDIDWSEPSALEILLENMKNIEDPLAYYNALPDKGQETFRNAVASSYSKGYPDDTYFIVTERCLNDGFITYIYYEYSAGITSELIKFEGDQNIGETTAKQLGIVLSDSESANLRVIIQKLEAAADQQSYYDSLSPQYKEKLITVFNHPNIFFDIWKSENPILKILANFIYASGKYPDPLAYFNDLPQEVKDAENIISARGVSSLGRNSHSGNWGHVSYFAGPIHHGEIYVPVLNQSGIIKVVIMTNLDEVPTSGNEYSDSALKELFTELQQSSDPQAYYNSLTPAVRKAMKEKYYDYMMQIFNPVEIFSNIQEHER